MWRRTRKDKGKKRKKYRGKPVKRYNLKRFAKKKGFKTHLKVWVWERRPMSSEGRKRWNDKARPYIKPIVTKFGDRIDVPVQEIANKKLVEGWAVERIGYSGTFLLMGLSGSLRSKRGVKWVKLCKIRITEHADGLHARMERDFRLFRYRWFYHN